MKFRKMGTYYILTALLVILPLPGLHAQNTPSTYLKLKESMRYKESINTAIQILATSEDPSILYFYLCELHSLSKKLNLDLALIKKVYSNPFIKRDQDLHLALQHIHAEELAKLGQFQKAAQLSGLLNRAPLLMAGPFKCRNREEFNTNYKPEKEFNREDIFKGVRHTFSWFKIHPDYLGAISISDLYPRSNDSLFYVRGVFEISRDDIITMTVGKNGFIKVWIDKKPVLINTQQHLYDTDQYTIKIKLKKGIHSLLIKTGSTSSQLQLSFDIRNSDNKSLSFKDPHSIPEIQNQTLLYSGYNSYLNNALTLTKRSDYQSYYAASLMFNKGLYGKDYKLLRSLTESISGTSPYRSTCLHFAAMSERDLTQRDFLLQQSIIMNPLNSESLHARVLQFTQWNQIENAVKILHEKGSRVLPEKDFLYLMGISFYSKGWIQETKKYITRLKNSGHIYYYHKLSAIVNSAEENYIDALTHYNYLKSKNQNNLEITQNLIALHKKRGDLKVVLKVYLQQIATFPHNIALLVQAAETVGSVGGYNKALTYLSAAQKRSPYNSTIHLTLSKAYYNLSNITLARDFIKRAQYLESDNESIIEFKNFISKDTKNPLDSFKNKLPLKQLSKKAQRYKNESSVTLLDEEIIDVKPNGSYRKDVRRIVQINTREGIKGNKNQFIILDPKREILTNLRCYTSSQGQRRPITTRYLQSLSDPESSLYYDLKAVVIPITRLRSKTIIELSYTIESLSGTEYKNYFGHFKTFGGKSPLLYGNFVIQHNASQKLSIKRHKIKRKNILKIRQGGKLIVISKIAHVKAAPLEPASPNEETLLPAIYASSHRSWDEVYKWYRGLLENRILVNSEMKKAVQAIVLNNPDQKDQVRQIFNYAIKRVRYVGIELGLGGLQPRRSDKTFNSGMGDCKDVSILLVALLKEAGIEAHLALVRTRDRGPVKKKIPYIGQFNHAICYVKLDKGYFIDGTVSHSTYLELPENDRDIEAFIIKNHNWSFINTGSTYYIPNKDEVENDLTMNSDGSVLLKRKLLKQGDVAGFTRFSLKNKKKKMKHLNEYWNEIFPGSEVSDIIVHSKTDEDRAEYSYTVRIPQFAIQTEKELIFYPFLIKSEMYKKYALSTKRETPIEIAQKYTLTLKNRIRLPKGYRVYKIPKSRKYAMKNFLAEYNFINYGNTIEASQKLIFKGYMLPAEKYQAFRKFLQFNAKKEYERIIIEEESP